MINAGRVHFYNFEARIEHVLKMLDELEVEAQSDADYQLKKSADTWHTHEGYTGHWFQPCPVCSEVGVLVR